MSYAKSLILLVATLQLIACATPRTNTPVPQLAHAQQNTHQIYNDVTDAKSSVKKARTLNQRIEDKLMLLSK